MCKAIKDLILEGKAEGKAEVVSIIRSMSDREMSAEDIAVLTKQSQRNVDRTIRLILQFPQKNDLEIARILVEGEVQQAGGSV